MTATETKEWDYIPASERRQESVVAISTAGLYALTLSQVFNPLALGIAAACAIGITIYNNVSPSSSNTVKGLRATGMVTPLPTQYSHIQGMTDEIRQAAGIERRTAVYLINDPEHFAVSLPDENAVLVSEPFLSKHNHHEQRFALAHEISHIRAGDSSTPLSFFQSTSAYTNQMLGVGLAITLAGSLLGIFGSSVIFASGISPLIGAILFSITSFAASLGFNYSNRIIERRADRNAIYLTRDPESATNLIRKVSPEHGNLLPCVEISSHPSYHPRIANLHAAFEEASAYPPPLAPIGKAATPAKPPVDNIP